MTKIFVKQGEPVALALRRLKEELEKEGTMDEVRRLQAFETPSQKKVRKSRILSRKMVRYSLHR